MALTERLGTIIEWYKDGDHSSDRLEDGKTMLFERIRNQKKLFTNKPSRWFLDIGCGEEGSEFVNRFAEEFPGTHNVYLDNDPEQIAQLNKPKKLCADAANMPFQDDCFDLAYIDMTCEGIVKERVVVPFPSYTASPYDYVTEARRILRPGGLLVFAYGKKCTAETDAITLSNLEEIGFANIEHLVRKVIGPGFYSDDYVATKHNCSPKPQSR